MTSIVPGKMSYHAGSRWRGAVISVICSILLFPQSAFSLPRVHEREIITTQQVTGSVGVVEDHYIAVVYSKTDRGSEYEMGFEYHNDIKLIHRRNWNEINEGEPVRAVYRQVEVIKETRNADASIQREKTVEERRLLSLEFSLPEKPMLSSGY